MKLRYVVITVSAFLIVLVIAYSYDAALRDVVFLDGWVLFAGMGVQILFHVKKKIPQRIFGSTTTWAEVHLYCGYFVIACFALHTRFSWPETAMESVLWVLFIVVVTSGLLGALLTNAIPMRLAQLAERWEFQDLPNLQSTLADKAHDLALASIQKTGTTKISDLYLEQLQEFFAKPHHAYAHLTGSKRPLKQMMFEIEGLDADLDGKSQKVLRELRLLVELKTRIDFQYAHEIALRMWLCVHVPATYALIVVSLLHIAVVYAYRSGVA